MTLKNSTDFFNEVYGNFKDKFATNQSPSFHNLLWQLIVNEANEDKIIVLHPAVIDDDGHWTVGIVAFGESGYTPTSVKFIAGTNFDAAYSICVQLNGALFGIMPKAGERIIAKSIKLKFSEL